MPKIVDHDERCESYLAALWRIVGREGAGAISVRAVAAEAGVSPSNVVHYLPSRAAMLAAAVRQMLAEARDRAGALGGDGVDLDVATDMVMVSIPTSPRRRRQSEVWLLLLAEREVNLEAAEILADLQSAVREAVRAGMDLLAENGLLHARRDRDIEATRLHSLIDGLSVHALIDHRNTSTARVREVVRNHLAELAAPPG